MPTDEAVVDAASTAAEDVIFSRIDRSAVADLDVAVSFEDGVLDLDVYVHAPESTADVDRVAGDAVLAARRAVDRLFEESAEGE